MCVGTTVPARSVFPIKGIWNLYLYSAVTPGSSLAAVLFAFMNDFSWMKRREKEGEVHSLQNVPVSVL